ncbi:MAG: ABC transporter ATP-binding protein [Bacteroidales bacterium]|nr:ABC transporter ATP-binding protein [Bacteroidales bacterium]
MPSAIEFEHISKQYRLGVVSSRTLGADLGRWWQMSVLGKEDPYLKVGETNDRAAAATSDFVWALRDIDFKVEQGEVLGIIGKNGAGKSTLLKLLSKVTGPTTGQIRARGRIASLLEVGTGFHPELTGRENVYMNGAILGMTRREITSKLDEIIQFAGVEKYIDTPTKRYSSGMSVRLGFAVASHLDPEIMVVDEVLAVGDAEFQKKAIGKMREISSQEGRTVLFVSHNMTSIRNLCQSGIVLENGMVSFSGTAEQAVSKYLSINQDENTQKLRDRTDRIGNGRIRVTDIVLKNKDGEVVVDTFAGDPLTIEFHLETRGEVDFSKMIVAVKLIDNYGTTVTMWVSDESKCDFSAIRDGVFSLDIPHLNMRPNTYNLGFQISLGTTGMNDWCDAIGGAAKVSVINNSFFEKGVNLKEDRGYIPLIDAKFRV